MRVPVKLSNPEKENGAVEEEALIDTGATWTCVPRALATRLELKLVGNLQVHTAAGPQMLPQSYAFLEIQGKSMVAPLLVSDTLDQILIGVTTLEALGFVVDPTKKELRDAEVLLL